MQCTASGCERGADYKGRGLCQMHYFRLRRTGSVELQPKSRKPFLTNAKGYVMRYEPEHPLAMVGGLVYAHRAAVFDKYGWKLPECEMCGARTNWATCHIDHRDENTANNDPDNLRPLCRGCNTSRTRKRTIPLFEYSGLQLSVSELARLPGVVVCRAQLKRRLDAGANVHEAMFGSKKTHQTIEQLKAITKDCRAKTRELQR